VTTKYEALSSGDSDVYSMYGVYWVAQTFTVGGTGHTVTSVKVKLKKYGSPSGNFVLGIRTTSGGVPTTTELTSGTKVANDISTTETWYEITVSEYTLAASTKYGIVCRVPSGTSSNFIWWRICLPPDHYAGGDHCNSSNSGVNWSINTNYDAVFEVWGNSLVTIPTVTTQAATGVGVD
jgi:hypothetical protein